MRTTSRGQSADAGYAARVRSVALPEVVRSASIALGAGASHGTVPATVAQPSAESYAASSEALIRGRPVHRGLWPTSAQPEKIRAKDLVAELDSINAQIHRIMFQVERAVARLATNG